MRGQRAQSSAGGAALLQVIALRSGVAYRAAEFLRRSRGPAKKMAEASVTSEEYAAVRLLIGTWDSIAARVRAGDIPMIPFFQSNPVSHMWEALTKAIDVIRLGPKGPEYASDFDWLHEEFDKWLKTKEGQKYKTAADQGINAHFG